MQKLHAGGGRQQRTEPRTTNPSFVDGYARAADGDAGDTQLRVDGIFPSARVSDWIEHVHADPLTVQFRSHSFGRRPIRIVEGRRGPVGMAPELLQEYGPTNRVMTSSGPFLLTAWRSAQHNAVSNRLHPILRRAAFDLVVHGCLEEATEKRPPELVRDGVPNNRRVERTITRREFEKSDDSCLGTNADDHAFDVSRQTQRLHRRSRVDGVQ